MRILILSHLFAHNTANTYRYWALAKYLSMKGYQVDIVGYKRIGLRQRELCDNIAYYSLLDIFKLKNSITLLWWSLIEFLKVFSKRKGFIIIRTGLLQGAIKIHLKRLLKKHQYEAIIIGVLPWSYYSFLPFLKKYSPLLLDVSDPLYKNAVLDPEQQGLEACKKLEYKAFGYADRIILMSEPLLGMYSTELGIDSSKMVFISPSISLPSDYQPKMIKYNFTAGTSIKLLYAGTIYPGYRDIEELEKGISGVNGYETEVISHLKKKNTDSVKYTDWINKEELYKRYETCDIFIFIDNFFGFQVPSKIFELLALQKPILFVYDERNKYLYHLLKNQKGIFFVRNNAVEIKEMLHSIWALKEITVNYTIDLHPYTDEAMCAQYEACIKNIVIGNDWQ